MQKEKTLQSKQEEDQTESLLKFSGFTNYEGIAGRFKSRNRDRLSTLSRPSENSWKEAVILGMREAVFLEDKKKTSGIYTEDASFCTILVASVKERFTGKTLVVGMMHAGADVEKKEIDEFFRQLAGKARGDTRISIISGNVSALKIFAASEKIGKIDFMNCDLDGARIDAVLVERNGKIRYGRKPKNKILSREPISRLPKKIEYINVP